MILDYKVYASLDQLDSNPFDLLQVMIVLRNHLDKCICEEDGLVNTIELQSLV
jgi:hypothetical protein